MALLQEIMRNNGSVVNHITIPQSVIQESMLKKGDELEVKCVGKGKIVMEKQT